VLDPLFGKHRLIDHWDHAVQTGKIAGKNMAGGTATYDIVSRFNTSVLGLTAMIWGEGRLVDHRIIRGGSNDSFTEIGVGADGRVAQAIAIGPRHDHVLLEAMVKQRVQVNGNEEQFKDPTVSLASLLNH